MSVTIPGAIERDSEPPPSGTGHRPELTKQRDYSEIGQMTATRRTRRARERGVTEVFGYDANRLQLTSQKAGISSPYTDRMNLTYSYPASAGQMGRVQRRETRDS